MPPAEVFEPRSMGIARGPLGVKSVEKDRLAGAEWVVEHLSCQAVRGFCCAGMIFASLQRFWAVAAKRNSSFAPQRPRNRNRPRPGVRLKWAKRISTLFSVSLRLYFAWFWHCLGRPVRCLRVLRGSWRESPCWDSKLPWVGRPGKSVSERGIWRRLCRPVPCLGQSSCGETV